MSNKQKRKLICIRCPRGCEVITTLDGYSIDSIEGNVCKLGEEYVKNEIKDPRRIITTTVKVKNGVYPLVSVWTTTPLPKNKIFDLMSLLRNVELEAPVKLDQTVIKNVFNTGVDVLTSSIVKKINNKEMKSNTIQ